jgi:Flp pilus assembly protein TadB
MSEQRLSRPLYEALPWFYIVCGLAGLVASYLIRSGLMSFALGLPGIVALVGGIVLLLRRRDYRRMRANYVNTGLNTDLNAESTAIPKRDE